MATTATNVGPDINRGLHGLATDWTLASISCIIVLLRLYTKGIVIRKLGWDDLLMSLALLTALGHAIAMTEAFHYGWGRHAVYLSELDRTNATKWIFISQGFGVVSPMCGRLAFCIYMSYIIGRTSRWQLYSLHVVSGLQLTINIVCVVMIYTQCGVHVKALWGGEIAVCLAASVQTDYGYFQSSFNSLSDLYLTILPAVILRSLQLRTSVKAGIAALLCLSVFAFAASVVKTYEIHILNERGDITWNFVNFVIWAALEINIVIIVASVPTLSPLFRRRAQQSQGAYSYELDGKASAAKASSGSKGYAQSRSSPSRRISRSGVLSAHQRTPSQEDILDRDGGRTTIQKTFEVEITSLAPCEVRTPRGHPDYGW
ncbi:hypothetical protein LTR36_001817 [Oleoguttula mirabilis]|uniref:Rhodopsin domain-containing protein n=1 Tax=Oleoguttula mirabilis TaxID=1507867 RepID=A0AAV9JM56_9PEZI|nr:hypothetical protein LTR36_001817 [Oleoguttula mirabilis]